MDVTVLLTRYRRDTTRSQLAAIRGQTSVPQRVIVFQNDTLLPPVAGDRGTTDFEYVNSSINTKFFGRFAYLLSVPSDYYVVLDDDVIPGPSCLENYLDQSESLQAIIGANGRIASVNPNKSRLHEPPDTGVRDQPVLVDYVGHMWVFTRSHLENMFSISPFTLETAEDMHLCFSNALRGVRSYVGAQRHLDEMSDTSMNAFAGDEHASFRLPVHETRPNVERHFLELGIDFISSQ